MLKPVHDHTVPKISPRRRVLGVTSQLTSSDLIPSHPKKAGTRPIGYSKMNRRTTPTTMSGVTIPRKMRDVTNEAPRTFCRRIARNKPMNRVSWRWRPIQIRLLRSVPQGGPRGGQFAPGGGWRQVRFWIRLMVSGELITDSYLFRPV